MRDMGYWLLVEDSIDDVFDALRLNQEFADQCAVRELELIARACDEYVVDALRSDAAAEKLVRGGHDGTADVGEFLALELAGLLQITPASAAVKICQVLDLRDRHPELWAHVHARAIKPWQALKVASRCAEAGLSLQAARWVDRQLAMAVEGLPWGRVVRALEGLIVSADAHAAAQRAEQLRQRRRVFVGDHREGSSVLFAQLDTEDALALDQTISDLANALAALGSAETVDQRRATALGVLADPQAALDLLMGAGAGRATNRAATLVVHIASEALHDPCSAPASRVDRVGPLVADTLRRFLADSHVVVRPVIDLNEAPAVDSYEIPARLRQHVEARNPVEVFPTLRGAAPASTSITPSPTTPAPLRADAKPAPTTSGP